MSKHSSCVVVFLAASGDPVMCGCWRGRHGGLQGDKPLIEHSAVVSGSELGAESAC